jgi:hypothetical protein
MRGDERALPARDRGPGKAFVRRWVDSRRLLSEYFIFIALAVLALSFIPSKVTQVLVFYGWVVMLAILSARPASWCSGQAGVGKVPQPR